MPELPSRKAGIVACSGEELAEGTVARLATLKVLHELRSEDTVTICLPLFLAGGEGERAFARLHPTITVDGCELRCAARGTEMYSGKPAASIVVNELIAQHGLGKPEGRRRLNEAGKVAVERTAECIAELVDTVLGKKSHAVIAHEAGAAMKRDAEAVTCSCGSGVPVKKLAIGGKTVEIVALPLIFQQFREAGRGISDTVAGDLLEAVKVYNAVPPEDEAAYRESMLREYEAYCGQEAAR